MSRVGRVVCCGVVRELLLQFYLQLHETCADDRWQHGGGSEVHIYIWEPCNHVN